MTSTFLLVVLTVVTAVGADLRWVIAAAVLYLVNAIDELGERLRERPGGA